MRSRVSRWIRWRAGGLRFRGGPLLALVLVLLQGTYAIAGVSPLSAGHCLCAHGPEVDCDCPHHGDGDGDAGVPACHRKMKAEAKAKAKAQPSLRVHCGSSGMKLVLLAVVAVPPREPTESAQVALRPARAISPRPPDISVSPPRQPPRSRI